ncbi:N-acetylglucosaminyl transferase component domain containing protein, putative [Eimeria mitis]|uniref:N-acetylglucosaminyl transferase component domain containing protein, putative n=1 Tax=Eimeria mitis TaxID=44415 RepID=U6KDF6_9EIME|nr:N-acetylglucosaminyl transferase component domain containing protein, putative [Eimeria mitis]CDJ36050.1 N-acetylglucosaminyl transferase component domain containing protein, putative [Eimeria mitis]
MHPPVCAAPATGICPAESDIPVVPFGACGVGLVHPLPPPDKGARPPTSSLPVACSPLFRLFFPLTLLEAHRGWLVGWGLPDGTAVACSLLPPLPLPLVALFLQQLNERLLKSSAPSKSEQGACSNNSSNESSESTSSNRNRNSSGTTSGARNEGDLVFDYHVLPQPVGLIGWWRGADFNATCPFPQGEVFLFLQQQQLQQQQHQERDQTGVEAQNTAVWLDLWLEGSSGLPVPLSIVSHLAARDHAATSAKAAAAAEEGGRRPARNSGADTAAGEGPPAVPEAPLSPTATASPRCVVFLYRLPSWVSSSTLAAAPHDAAQASAAAAFVQKPTAARALLQQVAEGIGTGGQEQQQLQQQRMLMRHHRGGGNDQLCGFEAYLALLNVSAAVYSSIQQQLRCWRLLQLRQQAAAAAVGAASSAEATAAAAAPRGTESTPPGVAAQEEQQGEGGENFSRPSSCRVRFVGCLVALLELLCYLLLSFANCVGVVCRGVCTLRLWMPFAAPSSILWFSASLQQIVMRFRICASWPGALSRKRRFAAALDDCRRREQEQQQQQAAAAAASGALQLGDMRVPALVSPQPRLQRSSLPGGLSVSALCLYTSIAAVVVDVLLGLFLPQLLAVLIYRAIPADACSPEYLSRLKTPPSEPAALSPLWPISLSETAPPQLYPFPQEERQQQQQRVSLLHELEDQQQQKQQLQHDGGLSGVDIADRSLKAQYDSSEHSCPAAVASSAASPPASGAAASGSAEAAGAAAAGSESRGQAAGLRNGGGVVPREQPSWRELMVEPTSTLLLRLFSGCYCFLHVDLLTAHVQWLMDFPAGLKLNANLTWVLGSVVLTASHLWNDLTAYLHSAVATAEERKRGLLLQLQQLQMQQHTKQHTAKPHTPPGLLQSLNETVATASHMLRSLLWQQTGEEPSAPTNPNTFAAPQQPVPAGSGGSSTSIRGLWGKFLRVWSACHLWVKTGLGSVLMTFRLGWLGLSASLFAAASADLLMVGTLHIFYVYLVCARLLHVNLKSLHSLFLLFRGQKWNVLRRRVDSADLQMDQLLIGCILFTITVCLFPTTLVFYISYLLLWLLVFGTHALLRLAVCLFLAYPTCLLAFRATAPHLLAAGVSFEPLTALKKQGCCGRSSSNSSSSAGGSSNNANGKPPHAGKRKHAQSPADAVDVAPRGTEAAAPTDASPAASSRDNIYFMLRARPISYGDIIWPPVFAAARNTLTPLHPSSLVPKILQGDIIRLSSQNSAWPVADS